MANTDFIASNGLRVTPSLHGGVFVYKDWEDDDNDTDGSYPVQGITPEGVVALREYFLAEEDTRLGRWRTKIFPHIYVRPFPGKDGIVAVIKDDEKGLAYGQFGRYDPPTLDPMSIVAADYFKAHPLKKPWHGAKTEEVWELTISIGADRKENPPTVKAWIAGPTTHFNSLFGIIEKTSTRILDGRRIWPESSTS